MAPCRAQTSVARTSARKHARLWLGLGTMRMRCSGSDLGSGADSGGASRVGRTWPSSAAMARDPGISSGAEIRSESRPSPGHRAGLLGPPRASPCVDQFWRTPSDGHACNTTAFPNGTLFTGIAFARPSRRAPWIFSNFVPAGRLPGKGLGHKRCFREGVVFGLCAHLLDLGAELSSMHALRANSSVLGGT